MAMIATNAEREKASAREDRRTNAKLFAVEPLVRDPRGSRDGIPVNRPGGRSGNRYEKPRRKFQWSSNRGAVQPHWAGPVQNSTGVNGTYSRRTDNRTSMGDMEGGAKSGPKNDDDCCAPRP